MNGWANEWIMQIAEHQVGYAHGENITFIFPRAHTQTHTCRRYRHWCSVSLSPSLSATHLFARSQARSFVYFSIFILRSHFFAHNTHFTAASTKEKPPVNINYLGLVFVCCLYCELMALLSFTGFSAHTLRFPCFILLQIKEHILIRRSWNRKCVCMKRGIWYAWPFVERPLVWMVRFCFSIITRSSNQCLPMEIGMYAIAHRNR